MAGKLTAIQRTELATIEAEIETCFGVMEQRAKRIGDLLIQVRDKKLYLQGYATIEEYASGRWGTTARRLQQWIAHAQAVAQIEDHASLRNANHGSSSADTPSPVLPVSERQTRPLADLPPEQRGHAWEGAVESANGKQPTAKQVEEAVKTVAAKVAPSKPNAKPKSGAVVFDDRPFADLFGRLVRFFEARAKVHPNGYQGVRGPMNAVHDAYKEWLKK